MWFCCGYPGTYRERQGAWEIGQCRLCDGVGEYSPAKGSSNCSVCEWNLVTNLARDACQTCRPGHTADALQVDCDLCKVGLVKDSVCVDCDSGRFAAGDGVVCIDCPVGHFRDGPGGRTSSDCTWAVGATGAVGGRTHEF